MHTELRSSVFCGVKPYTPSLRDMHEWECPVCVSVTCQDFRECFETRSVRKQLHFFNAMFKISRSYFPQGVLTRVFAASLGRLAVGVAAFALIFLGAGVARSGGGGGVEG